MKSISTTLLFFFSFLGISQEAPELFLAEFISNFPNVRDLAISPNGNEMMFTAQSVMGNLSAIVISKKTNNSWSTPKVASFSGQFFDLEPFYSNDGLKLYFVSTRPLSNETLEPKDFDIWFVERHTLSDTWSEPINLGFPINTEHGEFYPSIANNGNFYFTRDNPDLKTKDDIYVSEFKNGAYQTPVKLSHAINSDGYEYNAFIAPDESYLVFGSYNRKDGFGSGDLYISFKKDNHWTVAKNLGGIVNSDKMDYCPFVDTKTNTLYFTSKRDNTKINQEKPLTTEELVSELNKADNGSSRLYRFLLKNY
ncbi:TolB-like translocation protein [Formosa maritima]|uniref:Exo-alpha-sialidase n=1 Tax=Formosa maritima TaxID=2592046 RepID=A0A5D0GN02_9FLAO|nr:PD40 domain-containing protein [Formosa maritima]TYA60438.1 hypothetical protein FVF61_00020 [Formosa maritima]